jgi:hypothetical protein
MGFWEDVDQLNTVASFLDGKSMGALSCVSVFCRDHLRSPEALRWLAELRGLDPATTHIACIEHLELAEAMASLETSIGFERGSVEVRESALPSIRRVVGTWNQPAACVSLTPLSAGRLSRDVSATTESPACRCAIHVPAAAMLRRHSSLTLSVEAHCGLDAHATFARLFRCGERRRAAFFVP